MVFGHQGGTAAAMDKSRQRNQRHAQVEETGFFSRMKGMMGDHGEAQPPRREPQKESLSDRFFGVGAKKQHDKDTSGGILDPELDGNEEGFMSWLKAGKATGAAKDAVHDVTGPTGSGSHGNEVKLDGDEEGFMSWLKAGKAKGAAVGAVDDMRDGVGMGPSEAERHQRGKHTRSGDSKHHGSSNSGPRPHSADSTHERGDIDKKFEAMWTSCKGRAKAVDETVSAGVSVVTTAAGKGLESTCGPRTSAGVALRNLEDKLEDKMKGKRRQSRTYHHQSGPVHDNSGSAYSGAIGGGRGNSHSADNLGPRKYVPPPKQERYHAASDNYMFHQPKTPDPEEKPSVIGEYFAGFSKAVDDMLAPYEKPLKPSKKHKPKYEQVHRRNLTGAAMHGP